MGRASGMYGESVRGAWGIYGGSIRGATGIRGECIGYILDYPRTKGGLRGD